MGTYTDVKKKLNKIKQNKMNLKRIIKNRKLNESELAKQLFPSNKLPIPALKRVLDGVSKLDSDQIKLLQVITGLTYDEIFGSHWKAKAKKEVLEITYKNWTAFVDTKTMIVTIWKYNTIQVMRAIRSKAISINELTELLDEMINKEA